MRLTTVFAVVAALLLEGAIAAPAENSPALANAEAKRQDFYCYCNGGCYNSCGVKTCKC